MRARRCGSRRQERWIPSPSPPPLSSTPLLCKAFLPSCSTPLGIAPKALPWTKMDGHVTGMQAVMDEFTDMRLAYGESDEYSFALHKASKLYGAPRPRSSLGLSYGSQPNLALGSRWSSPLSRDTAAGRRASKLVSLVTSCFTANYVMLWPRFFSTPLQSAPMFDGRAVCYPTDDALRDYFAWRQADTHINNQVTPASGRLGVFPGRCAWEVGVRLRAA